MGGCHLGKQPTVRKWVILDKNGKVVIITRDKKIATDYARGLE